METWTKTLELFLGIVENWVLVAMNLREQAWTQLKHHKRQASNIPKIGDVVLIKDNLPWGRWKIGKIAELLKGRDQAIQAAKVLVEPGKLLQRVTLLHWIPWRSRYIIARLGNSVVIDNNAESGLDSDNNNGETQTGGRFVPSNKTTGQTSYIGCKTEIKRMAKFYWELCRFGSVKISTARITCDDSN